MILIRLMKGLLGAPHPTDVRRGERGLTLPSWAVARTWTIVLRRNCVATRSPAASAARVGVLRASPEYDSVEELLLDIATDLGALGEHGAATPS